MPSVITPDYGGKHIESAVHRILWTALFELNGKYIRKDTFAFYLYKKDFVSLSSELKPCSVPELCKWFYAFTKEDD